LHLKKGEHLSKLFGIETYQMKIVISIIYLVLTGIIIETEKIKPIGYAAGAMILLIGNLFLKLALMMYIDNTAKTLPSHQDPNLVIVLADFSQIGIFIGIGGWAYEAAGTIFSVRLSLKEPRKMERTILQVFSMIGCLFIIFSLSFALVYKF